METRRLRYLLELSRLGSMRAVAESLGTTTSTVSQQIAVLAREVGTPLLEPDGRRVRLTPAGRRLAGHAVTILAAVESARVDLDPQAEPAGTVRVAGFATAIVRSLVPVIDELARSHPRVRLVVAEHEPPESAELLANDAVDLALVYDYDLAPAARDRAFETTPLWSSRQRLAVPAAAPAVEGTTPEVLRAFSEHEWIGNSRNRIEDELVRTLASLAGFEPRITHQADSLDVVEDLIVAGLGVALLPPGRAPRPGLRLLPLSAPEVTFRAFAITRRGRSAWPPLTLVLDLLTGRRAPDPLRSDGRLAAPTLER
ncbi:LysR family transcriptional regulator [Actinomycetota bacterium]|nr:LysR family transcriptional regulator [Actinomycetota bacterium]